MANLTVLINYLRLKKSKNYIFGIRAVIEAIKSGKNLDKLLIKKGLKGPLFYELQKTINSINIPVQYVPVEKLNNITYKNHQGVIGYLSLIEYYKIDDLIPILFEQGKSPLILILDRISDVRNFGAICRVAECAGVHCVVIPESGSAQINADAIKTSAGAIHYLKISRVKNLDKTVLYLKNSGLQIIASTEKGNKIYHQADYSQPTAIIVGSEENGVSNQLLKISDCLVKIPVLGNIESLNVSTATSIIIYEALKQRLFKI